MEIDIGLYDKKAVFDRDPNFQENTIPITFQIDKFEKVKSWDYVCIILFG